MKALTYIEFALIEVNKIDTNVLITLRYKPEDIE